MLFARLLKIRTIFSLFVGLTLLLGLGFVTGKKLCAQDQFSTIRTIKRSTNSTTTENQTTATRRKTTLAASAQQEAPLYLPETHSINQQANRQIKQRDNQQTNRNHNPLRHAPRGFSAHIAPAQQPVTTYGRPVQTVTEGTAFNPRNANPQPLNPRYTVEPTRRERAAESNLREPRQLPRFIQNQTSQQTRQPTQPAPRQTQDAFLLVSYEADSNGKLSTHKNTPNRSAVGDGKLEQGSSEQSPLERGRRLGRPNRKANLNKTKTGGGSKKRDSLFSPQSLVGMLGSLVLVVGLFILCLWVMRRSMPAASQPLPAEVVTILGRLPLASRQMAQLIHFGNKLVLVSVTPNGCETLSEVTDPAEVNHLLGLLEKQKPNSSSANFQKVFSEMGKEPAAGFLGKEGTRFNQPQHASAPQQAFRQAPATANSQTQQAYAAQQRRPQGGASQGAAHSQGPAPPSVTTHVTAKNQASFQSPPQSLPQRQPVGQQPQHAAAGRQV